ncbi:MAG: hypothetical protein LBU11_11215 [Zoogloeaceae bacterium]|jgi:hypothetical protein|nr:hypothetical protein [Zoogloeaceae bacterium]
MNLKNLFPPLNSKIFLYGMVFFAGIFLSSAVQANEPVLLIAIEDRDAFERKYLECFKSGLENKCFSTLFSDHLDFGAGDTKKFSNQVDGILTRQMPECLPVYNVYAVDNVIRGGVFDNRTYLIECSNRKFVGVEITFRKTRGQWHVSKFHIGASDKILQDILNLPEY